MSPDARVTIFHRVFPTANLKRECLGRRFDWLVTSILFIIQLEYNKYIAQTNVSFCVSRWNGCWSSSIFRQGHFILIPKNHNFSRVLFLSAVYIPKSDAGNCFGRVTVGIGESNCYCPKKSFADLFRSPCSRTGMDFNLGWCRARR